VLGGLALASVLYVTTVPNQDRVRLIAPQKNAPQVAPETLRGRVRQGVSEFLVDTFDSYVRAENDLVYIVSIIIKTPR